MTALPASFAPRKILVCQLRQLGDVILTTPALELLHKRYPDAELHLLTEQKCVSLLGHNPHVTKVWGLDKRVLHPVYKEIAWHWHLAREQRFDLVVDFQQLPRCRWAVAFSGASVRLSYPSHWYLRPLYTHTAVPEDGYAAMSKVSILAPLGIQWHGERPQLYLTDAEREAARGILRAAGWQEGQRLISLDPTHRQPTRRWPVEHYARLVRLLVERDSTLRVLPLWGPGEEADIRQLAAGCPQECLLMPDRMLSLREMAACIAEASLHIGNCSAPRHMAVAVDTPSCVVLGATSSAWTYPSPKHVTVSAGLPCQPCNRNQCTHRRCLEALAPETVLDAAWSLLS